MKKWIRRPILLVGMLSLMLFFASFPIYAVEPSPDLPPRAITPDEVYEAIEKYGPQARPYNFDDHYDCWGFVRQIYRSILDGYNIDDQASFDDSKNYNWQQITNIDELVPGDIITTYPNWNDPNGFHALIYYGKLNGQHLVYDSSPRGSIPIFDEDGHVIESRNIYTKYMRATQTTSRLRNEGGAYLRLWFDGGLYYNKGFHQRLLEGNPDRQVNPVTIRSDMGLTPLPFYNMGHLPLDLQGREIYDNQYHKTSNYYVPDGAIVMDEVYESVFKDKDLTTVNSHPHRPVITSMPEYRFEESNPTVIWEYLNDDITGCKIEIFEETPDILKQLLFSKEFDQPITSFTVPDDILKPDTKYAVCIFAKNSENNYSTDSVSTFIYHPSPSNPLLSYNPIKPYGLSYDNFEKVTTLTPTLTWSIYNPSVNQVEYEISIYKNGNINDGQRVYFKRVKAPDSLECEHRVPLNVLEFGNTYYWYIQTKDIYKNASYTPAEGIFTVNEN